MIDREHDTKERKRKGRGRVDGGRAGTEMDKEKEKEGEREQNTHKYVCLLSNFYMKKFQHTAEKEQKKTKRMKKGRGNKVLQKRNQQQRLDKKKGSERSFEF